MKPRKLLSLFLAVLMVATLLPVSALAAEISSTGITITVPTAENQLSTSANAAPGITVDSVKWFLGATEVQSSDTAKFGTTYKLEVKLSPASADDQFADAFSVYINDLGSPAFANVSTVVDGTKEAATVTAEYTTAKAAAPTVNATTAINVANTGATDATYNFTAANLLTGDAYTDGGIKYTVSETEDTNNILTLGTTEGVLADTNAITYTVAPNAANQPAKTAKFKIEFSAKDAAHDYQTLPLAVEVTVNLAAGDADSTITIGSVSPTDDPIEKAAGYDAFDLTVNATAADSSPLSYAWSLDGAPQGGATANTFTVPANLAAGDHTVTCKVTSATNTTGVTKTFNIKVAEKTGIPVPAVKNPVYNGTAQEPVVTPSAAATGKYDVTVTPQTDVKTSGGYTVTFSLKDKAADTWLLADGTTTTDDQVLTWNVDPKPVKVYNVKATDKVYDGSSVVRITAGELKKNANGSEPYTVLTADDVTLGSAFRYAAANDANAGVNKTVTVSGYTLSGTDAANYRLIQPDDVRVTIHPATPSIRLYNYTTAYTGLPVHMSGAVVSGIPGGTMPTGYVSYTYYTNSACSQQTTAADGAAYPGSAPSAPGTYYVVAYLSASGNYTSAYAYAAIMKIVTEFDVNYDIYATANRGGSISPSGSVKVASGGDKTFTFKPKAGYELVDVLVDGESVGAVSSYTFRDVKADHTIKAIFTAENEEVDPPVIEWKNPFYDVSRGDWFYASVEYVSSNGLMEGISSTQFAPAAVTTRSQLVTILWRLAGEPDAKVDSGFTDLTQRWYTEAVNWAAENKIVEGVSATKFAPDDIVTREQIVTILYRYAMYKGYDTSAYSSFNKFVDGAAVSGFAEDAMHWAVSENLIIGKEGNRLDPKGAASRAEIAAMLQRFVTRIVD